MVRPWSVFLSINGSTMDQLQVAAVHSAALACMDRFLLSRCHLLSIVTDKLQNKASKHTLMGRYTQGCGCRAHNLQRLKQLWKVLEQHSIHEFCKILLTHFEDDRSKTDVTGLWGEFSCTEWVWKTKLIILCQWNNSLPQPLVSSAHEIWARVVSRAWSVPLNFVVGTQKLDYRICETRNLILWARVTRWSSLQGASLKKQAQPECICARW